MDNSVATVLSIFTGILTVAIIALIVSRNSNTAGVISAFTTGFGRDLQVAVSPVTGGGFGGLPTPQLGGLF